MENEGFRLQFRCKLLRIHWLLWASLQQNFMPIGIKVASPGSPIVAGSPAPTHRTQNFMPIGINFASPGSPIVAGSPAPTHRTHNFMPIGIKFASPGSPIVAGSPIIAIIRIIPIIVTFSCYSSSSEAYTSLANLNGPCGQPNRRGLHSFWSTVHKSDVDVRMRQRSDRQPDDE